MTPNSNEVLDIRESTGDVSFDELLSPDMAKLLDLLGLSTGEETTGRVHDFVSDFIGYEACSKPFLKDLVLLKEEDFQDYNIPAVIQRKFLLLADFLRRDESLDGIQSMKEIFQSLYILPPTSSKSLQTHTKDHKESTGSSYDLVQLNVGGFRFETTRKTLCRVPGSFLEAMFSGRHEKPSEMDKSGAYFIDRNGSQFHHVLDFLRIGAVVALPISDADKEVLVVEADFYGLPELSRAIRMPKTDIEELLDDETKAFRQEEMRLRLQFREADETAHLHPKDGIVDLFCPDHGVETLPIRYDPLLLDPAKASVLMKLRSEAAPGSQVTACSMEEFQTNFNREHGNILHRLSSVLNEDPVIIAGGAVLRALTKSDCRTSNWWGSKSDIDLFVHSQTPAEASRIARRIFYALAADHEEWVIMRTAGVITMQHWMDGVMEHKVQIVLRLYKSPAEVLFGFDCDSCCCAYNGNSVLVTPRWMHAMRHGVNTLNPLHSWPNKASYELRLAKYAFRGFPVVIPGMDKNRVDVDKIRRAQLKDLKGLARLIKVSFEMEIPPTIHPSDQERPLPPASLAPLRGEVVKSWNDIERVVKLIGGYYDDLPNTIVISKEYDAGMIVFFDDGNFPRAMDVRDAAWQEIEIAVDTEVADGIPVKLLDSWDCTKRSREYLNANADKFDLDNLYYAHAYRED